MTGAAVPGAPASQNRLPDGTRFVALDSLRGIAALGVFVTHYYEHGHGAVPIPALVHGHYLVDLFFVISGFVIAASYGARLAGGYPVARFLALRLGRIYPLHLAAMLAMAILLGIPAWLRPDVAAAPGWGDIVRGLFLLDWRGDWQPNAVAPVSWSIAVELVLYVIVAALWPLGRAGRLAALAFWAGTVIALANGWQFGWFGPLLQRGVVGFGFGVLAFALHERGVPRWLGRSAAGIGAALLIGTFVVLSIDGLAPDHLVALHAAFFALVSCIAACRGWLDRILCAAPLVFCGTVSYSIYLIHPHVMTIVGRLLPVIDRHLIPGLLGTLDRSAMVQLGLLCVLTLVLLPCAWLAYRLIEAPARSWSRRRLGRSE